MDAKTAVKLIAKNIEQLERAAYEYDQIIKPRAERDKQILEQLREHHSKLQILVDKVKRGEPITTEEYEAAVPKEFR